MGNKVFWLGLWLWVSGQLLLAQQDYRAFFSQSYVRGSSNAPDSIDIYLFLARTATVGTTDTLASSNFPFLFNPLLLRIETTPGVVREIYRDKFNSSPYYDPIIWTVEGARVNVTVRRSINYAQYQGDAIDTLDTLIGLRVPLLACGPQRESMLLWDTTPAAVLNSQLQSIKGRILWRNSDTLALCPAVGASTTLSISPPNPPNPHCEGRPLTFTISLSQQGNSTLPDSFVVHVEPVSPSGPLQVFPNLVIPNPPNYTFQLTFSPSGTYTVSLYGVDRKCGCSVLLLRTPPLSIQALPPVLPIIGPDTVYAGGNYYYSLPQTPSSSTWAYTPGGGIPTLLGSSTPIPVVFDPPSGPFRVDTID
ncbi:MAG: hypothetical protein N2170_02965, partial [Bacteroidia bacterium]|nr:hypothetical protein [Bacteroidia bacterium]